MNGNRNGNINGSNGNANANDQERSRPCRQSRPPAIQMQEMLAPWLSRVDMYAFGWRSVTRGIAPHSVTPASIDVYASTDCAPPSHVELAWRPLTSPTKQVVLREAVELLALAFRINPEEFVKVVYGQHCIYNEHAPGRSDRVCVKLHATGSSCDVSSSFHAFLEWKESMASPQYKETKAQLTLYSAITAGPLNAKQSDPVLTETEPSCVDLCLNLTVGSQKSDGIDALSALVGRIDTSCFRKTTVLLQVGRVAQEDLLKELFCRLDELNDTAAVQIEVLETWNFHTDYAYWRLLFKLVTRSHAVFLTKPLEPAAYGKWDIIVGWHGDALWQALGHDVTSLYRSTTRITSLTVKPPMVQRLAFYKILAEMMTSGVLETLDVRLGRVDAAIQNDLGLDAIDTMEAVFRGGPAQDGSMTIGARSMIKSLTLELHDQHRLEPVYRFVALAGWELTELRVDGAVRLPVAAVSHVLDWCPQLRRLSIQTMKRDVSGVGLFALTKEAAAHSLEALSIQLYDVHIRQALLRLIQQRCSRLHELRLSIKYRLDPTRFLTSRQDFWNPEVQLTSFKELKTLTFCDAGASDPMVCELLEGLSSSSNPLCRSLVTLDVNLQHSDRVIRMLKSNYFLSVVRLSFFGVDTNDSYTRALETDGIEVHRVREPLSVECRLALLSCLQAKSHDWKLAGIARVFDYAAPAKLRRVKISASAE